MILFKKWKTIKDPKKFAGFLLREMYPANDFSTMDVFNPHIKDLKRCLDDFLPLNKYQLDRLSQFIEERFIHHSTLIENNNINNEGVTKILRENKVIPNISLNEHIEIVNHKEALDYIKERLQNDKDLSREILLHAHYLVLKGLDTKNSGILRTSEEKIISSDYEPPKPEELDEQIYKYFQYYNNSKYNLDPIILASEMHAKLCFIKPFTDGNGIVARLFMNYILMKHGYPIVNISGTRENKIRYFQSLENFPTNPEVFYQFITMCVFKSLAHYIKNIIPLVSKDADHYFYDQLIRKCGFEKKDRLLFLLNN